MSEPLQIQVESCGCPPYLRGMIFRRQEDVVWVIEEVEPIEGKIQIRSYRLPKPILEEDKEDE